MMRVAITENDDNSVIVTSGSPFTRAWSGGARRRRRKPVEHEPGAGGAWNVYIGPGCGGWLDRGGGGV